MTMIKTMGVVSALGMALAVDAAPAQAVVPLASASAASVSQVCTFLAAGQVVTGGAQNGKSGSGKKDQPEKPSHPDRPDQPDKPGKGNSTGDLKKMLEDIEIAKAKFLEEDSNLNEKAKKASKEQREKIRQEIREKREQFLEQQKAMREELRKRAEELKQQLKDHQDVIDNVKEQTKDKVRERKGGGD